MTPASHQGPSKGLHLPSKSLQTPSAHTPTTAPTTPRTAAEPGDRAPRSRKRPRSIACISCNKQKKTCGSIRPCPRCVHLNIPCQQPVKPEGFLYCTKKQKISGDVPLSPPVSPEDHNNALMAALRKAAEITRRQNGYLPHSLPPSPSPSISTVGTPQDSYTSISSYDDPATGKNGDTTGLSPYMSSHSASLSNETPKSLPIPDMSRWSLPALPAPAAEVPYHIVKNSIFNGAPIFGLEKSIYDPGDDAFAEFGEPIDLADLFTDVADNMEIQGTKEREEERGGDVGDHDEGKRGVEAEHVVAQGEHVVAAGSTMSGIASESGCGSGIAWLDAADLLTDGLVLDDVDLSNLDIPGLDDIVIDPDVQQLLELSISKPATTPTLSELPRP